MMEFIERLEMIKAAEINYIAGEWSRVRCEPVLRACGLTATEVEDFFREHSAAAFEAMKNRSRSK